MSDADIRELERRVLSGDRGALELLYRARARAEIKAQYGMIEMFLVHVPARGYGQQDTHMGVSVSLVNRSDARVKVSVCVESADSDPPTPGQQVEQRTPEQRAADALVGFDQAIFVVEPVERAVAQAIRQAQVDERRRITDYLESVSHEYANDNMAAALQSEAERVRQGAHASFCTGCQRFIRDRPHFCPGPPHVCCNQGGLLHAAECDCCGGRCPSAEALDGPHGPRDADEEAENGPRDESGWSNRRCGMCGSQVGMTIGWLRGGLCAHCRR